MSNKEQKQDNHRQMIIIGSGPAGYTAAIYAARASINPLMIAGNQPGGQLTITTDVENYPGFAEAVQGPWLMEQMREQSENVGTELLYEMVTDVDFSKRPFTVHTDGDKTFTADTVVISTGAKARWLGLESEEKLKGFGVSACATCDGFFFKEKDVAVVGGGNSAVEEALFLTKFAKSVTVIHRRDELRAEKIMQERLFKNEKITVLWDHVLEEVIGDLPGESDSPGVSGIKVKNVKTDEMTEHDMDGVFIAIGHDPATDIFKGKLDMDDEGYIITTPESTATSIPGVYAAGDVKDKIYRQAVTAAGMGCMAALEAERYLSEQDATDDGALKETSAAAW